MDKDKLDRIVATARQVRDARAQGYREQALALFPHVCARCGRVFEQDQLHELTVHHRDHDHDNNPGDGSNWELLCIYCHDNEHQRLLDAAATRTEDGTGADKRPSTGATFRPFAGLRSTPDEDKSE